MEITRPLAASKNRKDTPERREKNNNSNNKDLKKDHRKNFPAEPYDGAVEFNGILGDITPEVASLLEKLRQKIEPLEERLRQADILVNSLKEKNKYHTFLPVFNRSEFFRELEHLSCHLDGISNPSTLLMLYFPKLEIIRTNLGRKAMDRALTHIIGLIKAELSLNDILGALGGSDFAVILAGRNKISSERRYELIKEAIENAPFIWDNHKYQLTVRAGLSELEIGLDVSELVRRTDLQIISKQ